MKRKIQIGFVPPSPTLEKKWWRILKSAPIGAHIVIQGPEHSWSRDLPDDPREWHDEVELVLLGFLYSGRREYIYRRPNGGWKGPASGYGLGELLKKFPGW